ncbi:MAG TPA: trypsin-like peptidase domain-containing protein [Candidatus Dormibacteraeota bacterium]|nr:trypsin-like peptidase domain-containing protein [Candidatus Dormibacteraeota bacterium]
MSAVLTAEPTVEPLAAAAAAMAAELARVTVEVRGRGAGGAAVGAGVIWHPDGLILTNAHVVHRDVTVVLADGRACGARLVARDPRRDLAALVVDATGLPAAEIGDSGALRVGELVLAVGNPLGLVRALSAGLVHAVGPRAIHADLRLAPGNSGGPLADARGRVVGLNAMIVGGLAVAVPSREAQRFVREQLRG